MLPVGCAGCGAGREPLCGGCRAALSGAGAGCVRPAAAPAGLPAVYAAAAYGGAVRGVVLAHKERGALPLAGALGTALAAAVRTAAPGCAGELVLVPVPSARHRVRARGHDPGRRIALAASARLRRAGVPARVAPVLRLRRAVADQAGLGGRGSAGRTWRGPWRCPGAGVALLARGPRRRRRAGRAGPGSCSWTMWSPPAPRSPRRPGRCARRGSARWPRRLWSPLRRARSDGEIPPATRTEQKNP
ncbi:hypothetical protein GCM10020254_51790 [Streptomyces goshikiensis]